MLESNINTLITNLYLIVDLALMIAIPVIIYKLISKMLIKLENNGTIEKSSIETLIKILRYIIVIIIILGVLEILGINIRSLVISLGLVTVAVSLAAKDTLSNIISGLIILVEKRFEVEDMIEINGHKGQVKKIGFKSVQLFSNNQLTVIPNVLFTTTPFKNYTKTGFYIVPFTIQIVNKSDLDEVIKEISEILDNSDLILKNPSYSIFVKSIGTSGVEIVIKVPISNPLDDTMVVSELLKEFKRKIIFEDL
ncbi:MAG: mechanosensitive ion channel family protein [Methanosphaera sp.]|jgi:small conductance mechanosensitive channel|uniref:mechanosensitive ion channel family protein n=1 Tax=Methanosphaera TaxID=2316 RepID=UPI0023802BE6|nr:mechanosensitive ion channel domain-containing protein [Candidatus Methanosphaera massiliense]MDD6285626.1 mechanosensitive ion channel [Methanobacteriaceae archaeon]MDE4079044.1 mechanosensitive ion channel [Candidatus Methanosphaera massiliense]MDY2744359.1 mechanosensitive ion channel [Methanosphaera sp.]